MQLLSLFLLSNRWRGSKLESLFVITEWNTFHIHFHARSEKGRLPWGIHCKSELKQRLLDFSFQIILPASYINNALISDTLNLLIQEVCLLRVHPFHRRRQWQPTPVLLPGKSHGWRSLVGCSPWDWEESDTTEQLHFHFSLSCIGEGNGNPLQCSCLENPRDGGDWWAAIYGVAQSWTRLKRLSSSILFTGLRTGGKGHYDGCGAEETGCRGGP